MNTGRQKEFDGVKALFMLAIFVIHAFQVCGSGSAQESNVYRIIYITGVMSGAPIYTFVMGLGMNYSKRDVKAITVSGLKLIGFQYLNNLAYVAALLLGVLISTMYLVPDMDTVMTYTKINLAYINIFFMAGVIYLLLAFFKKIHLHPNAYLALGIAFAVISPFLAQKQTGIPWLDIILSPVVGGKPYTSFAVLPYISYALLGVYFGGKLRNTRDKDKFYKRLMLPCGLIAATFLGYAVLSNGSLEAVYNFFGQGYIYPDIFRVFNNISMIILLAGAFYFMRDSIEKRKKLNQVITFVSTNISKYYAIHATVYMFFFGVLGINGVNFFWCIVLCAACIVITEIVVRGYCRMMSARSRSRH